MGKLSEPTPRQCSYCDFGFGYRAMDECQYCDGTGSVFRVKDKTFPNTKDGYKQAKSALSQGDKG